VSTTELNLASLSQAVSADPGEANLCALADRVKAGAVRDAQLAVQLAGVLVQAPGASARARVRALIARAHAASYGNDFDGARADLGEAVALAQAQGLSDERGPALLALVQPLARQGLLAQAQSTAQEAIDLCAGAGQHEAAAKGEVNLGGVRMMRGDAAGAIGCYDRALAVLGASAMVRAMIQSNRAEALLELDRFDEAEAAFRASAEAFESAGHAHAGAVGLGNLADMLSRVGRVDEAVRTFEDARARLLRLGAQGDALRLQAEQAECLASVGAVRASLPLYDEAAPGLERAGLRREHARALLGQGLALLRAGRAPEAFASLQQAEKTAQEIGAPHLRAEAQMALAEPQAGAGDAPGARASLEQATAALADRPVRLAAAWATRAGVELRAGDAGGALGAIEQAERALSDLPVPPLRVRLQHLRGRCLLAQGQDARACEVLQEAAHGAEAFRGAIRAELVRVSYLESAQQLFLDGAHACLRARPHDAAPVLELTERLRQRSMLDAQPAHEHEGARGAELYALYARLGPSGRAGDKPEARERLGARLRELEQQQRHRTLVAQSAAGGPIGAHPLPAHQLRASAPEGHVYAGLFADGDDLSCVVLSRDALRVRRALVPGARWQALARRLDLALSRACAGLGDGAPCEGLAGELAEAVLGPLAPELAGARAMTLAPFGALHAAPLLSAWRALADTPAWLVPSATFGAMVGARPGPVAWPAPTVLAVGVADEGAPLAEREALEVGRLWPGARTLTGAQATPGAVLGALAGADIVHIASHALFDAEFPASSRVMLAGGWLTARELAGAIRPGALVVLAGCSTARAAAWGEDHQGLVRTVLGAGARAVLAAQWPLHDEGSAGVVLDWHRRLRGGAPGAPGAGYDLSPLRLARALQEAQRHARAQGAPFHHWAGLTLTGAWA
jgi:tetratricopeptide (TPR) repeat protein